MRPETITALIILSVVVLIFGIVGWVVVRWKQDCANATLESCLKAVLAAAPTAWSVSVAVMAGQAAAGRRLGAG